MSQLFSSFKIRDVELRNRIVVSPMCQYSSTDGFANDWHFVHLGSRAVGGAALVFTEATATSPEGRISPYDLGIWKDEHIEQLKKIATFIEKQGAAPGMQLAHAGRKASKTEPWNGDKLIPIAKGGWKTLAPSAIPFSADSDSPEELTIADIKRITADFGSAAERALKAGFKVLEIHGAHGYLVNEFLSPLSNKRNDEYGRTFDNRIRFLLEITEAIRAVWPEGYPLFLRISASDWTDGGWTIADSVELAKIVKTRGIDLIDCSSGGVVADAKIPAAPGYQVPFAEAVRKEASIPTGTVGIIVSAEQAEEIVSSGKADLIFMARELLRDPYFPLRAARELGCEISWPLQYERAKRKK